MEGIRGGLLDYLCQPCGITIPAANVGTHLAGRKHLKRCADLRDMHATDANVSGIVQTSPQLGYGRDFPIFAGGDFAIPPAQVAAGVRAGTIVGKQRWTPPVTGGGWRDRIESQPDRWASLFDPARNPRKENPGPGERERREIYAGGNAVTKVAAAKPDPSAFTLQSESSTARIYCDACERQLNTTTGFAAHMAGNTHRRSMEAKLAAGDVSPSKALPADPVIADDRWYCNSCKTDVRADLREEHLGSLLHALGRGEIPMLDGARDLIRTQPTVTAPAADIPDRPPAPGVPIDAFHCVPCGRTRKIFGFDGHMKSASHQKAMLALGPVMHHAMPSIRATHGRARTWFCEPCMVNLHVNGRAAHLAGKQHVPEPEHFALGIRHGADEVATVSSEEETTDDESPRLPVFVRDSPARFGTAQAEGSWRTGELAKVTTQAEDPQQDVISRATDLDSPVDTASTNEAEEEETSDDDDDTGGASFQGEMWDSSGKEGLDHLNQVVRRRELRRVTVERLALRLIPTQEGGSQMKPQTPANHAEVSTLCHVCLATYDSSEGHLHTSVPWHCETCDTILHAVSKSEHLSSVSHRLKASAPSPPKRAFTPASKATFFCLPCRGNFAVLERKFHVSPSYYCALCQLVMHTDTRDIHEWSAPHSQAVAAATARAPRGGGRFSCWTCGDSFPLAVQPFHRSRAWTCELCEKTVHMDWIGAHLMSAGHIEREESAEE